MALIINEEQKMLKESTKEFLDLKSPLSSMRNLRDNNFQTYNKELWVEMVEMGWTSLTIPEKYNGLNFGYVGLGQVLEEMGRKLTVSPIISTVLTSSTLINLSKNEILKTKLFQEIMNGAKLLTLAHEEGKHHNSETLNTLISKEADSFVLNGKKNFVIDGSISDYLIVSAKDESGSNTLLALVDAGAKGIKYNHKVHMDSRTYSDIIFDNVKIEKDNFLSFNGDGKSILDKTFDISRIGLASEMLGSVREAFEITMAYLKEREQFGVKIGSFQALQHRSALMFGEIELCKSIVLKALQSIDSNDSNLSKHASLAKAKLGMVFKLVSNEAVQMHGGIGVTDDADVGFFLKRARVIQRILGDSNYHLDRLARIKSY